MVVTSEIRQTPYLSIDSIEVPRLLKSSPQMKLSIIVKS